MKLTAKLFGIIALIAVTGFTFVSCKEPGSIDPPEVYVPVSGTSRMVSGTGTYNLTVTWN